MKDWTTQSQPQRSMMLFGEPSYEIICKKIYDRLEGMTAGDTGQLEIIIDNWCFCIDYRINETYVSLWCAILFHEGNEVRRPWLDWTFDEAKPYITQHVESPQITDYHLYI